MVTEEDPPSTMPCACTCTTHETTSTWDRTNINTQRSTIGFHNAYLYIEVFVPVSVVEGFWVGLCRGYSTCTWWR